MRIRSVRRGVMFMLTAMCIVVGGAGTAHAITSTSNNYQMTETQFGSSQNSCSGQYCAQASIGEATDGRAIASSTVEFQDVVDNVPLLDVVIEAGASDLGVLSTEKTATKTTTVRVRNYLTGGYTLQMIGDPPKFEGHTLRASTEPTASTPGVEQFAVNAVANTAPVVGSNPVQIPADQKAFGVVNTDYQFANLFKYASQDTIAHSTADSGHTDYTISMIVNISSSTRAGNYSGDFTAVVIPAF
jgi:methionine-rich copper-binding protein CopC